MQERGPQDLKCPECGSAMELAFGPMRLRSGRKKPYYRCYKFPECRGTHGAHPDGTPMGIPGDAETRLLRKRLHKELDKRFPWKTQAGRTETYKWLGENGYGHIGSMSAAECKTVLAILGAAL